MTASTAQTVFEPLADRDAVLATMKQINSVIARLTAAKKPESTSPPDPRARYQEASIALRRLRAYTGDLLDIRKRMEIEKGALIYVAFLNEARDVSAASVWAWTPFCVSCSSMLTRALFLSAV